MQFIAVFLLLLSFFPRLHAQQCEHPDTSHYEFISGDYQLSGGRAEPAQGKIGIYVDGNVRLEADSYFTGFIYASGSVSLGEDATISEDVYALGEITLGEDADILGVYCGNAQDIIIALPVDELTGQCNAIFEDAAQSFAPDSVLHMQQGTQILDYETHTFSFASTAGNAGDSGHDIPIDSCGDLTCGINLPLSQSLPLSDFLIPHISSEYIGIWSDTQAVFGESGDDKGVSYYDGTTFGTIVAGGTSVVTFSEQDYQQDQFYKIDTLIAQDNSTVKLMPGVYAIREFKLDKDATIESVGDGDLFLFIEAGAYNNYVNIQGTLKSNGNNKIYFTANSDAHFNNESSISAAIYINGDLVLDNTMTVYGQVTAKNVKLNENALVVNEMRCGINDDDDLFQLEVVTSPDALTCEPHPLAVNITNTEGEDFYTGKIALTSDSENVTWQLVEGEGELSASIGGQASYQFFRQDQGHAKFSLSNSNAETVTISVSGEGLEAQTSEITFHSALIKTELSCTANGGHCINIANQPFDLTLTAIKQDPDSLLCKSYDPVAIGFWSEYVTPSVTAGTAVEIDQQAISGSEQYLTPIPLSFVEGVAQVKANYPDSGQINIHVKDVSNEAITGQAGLIVNPHALYIDAISDNPAESNSYDATKGKGFMSAAIRNDNSIFDAVRFDVTVRAIIDCSDDPLEHCKNNIHPSAPSFSHNVTLQPSLVFPEKGRLGNVYAQEGINALDAQMYAGEVNYNGLTYDEVGVLGLQAVSEDYIQAGNDLNASSIKKVGRFYPAYIAYGDHSVSSGCDDFTYMAADDSMQPFSQSSANLSYTLQAKAYALLEANAPTTQNYDHLLGYPVAQDFNDRAYSQHRLQDLSARIIPHDYYDQQKWSSGVYMVNAQSIGVQKSAAAADGPYFSSLPLDSDVNDQIAYYIQLTGQDGEKIQHNGTLSCTADACRLPKNTNLSSLGDFAYGRLLAGNGHGNEHKPINTLLETHYFNGEAFTPFTRDRCTAITRAQMMTRPAMNDVGESALDSGVGVTQLSIVNSPLLEGKGYVQFSAPQARGGVDYLIRLQDEENEQQYTPWLLDSGNRVSCTTEGGGLDECISGRVQFGLFRGNDRIIYRKQTFNE